MEQWVPIGLDAVCMQKNYDMKPLLWLVGSTSYPNAKCHLVHRVGRAQGSALKQGAHS